MFNRLMLDKNTVTDILMNCNYKITRCLMLGGFTNIKRHCISVCLILFTPCISMSRMQMRPDPRTSAIAFLLKQHKTKSQHEIMAMTIAE